MKPWIKASGIACALLLLVCPARSQDNNAIAIPTTKLELHPAKLPTPALRYRLYPELRNLRSGNAVIHYYRAFSPEWSNTFERDPLKSALNEYYSGEDRKEPNKILRVVLTDSSLKELDEGARRTYCDWEMLERVRKDGIGTLLPDMQGFRRYGNLLSLRARFQAQDKDFDAALYTLQTGFKFGRDISEGPILIQNLIGNAITRIMLQETEFFIQQKGAPNLYWALSSLPQPFVDTGKAIEGERLLFDNLFPGVRENLNDMESKAMSTDEINGMIDRLFSVMKSGSREPGQVVAQRLAASFMAAQVYPEGKQYLLDQGRSPKTVNAMPVGQVFLLYSMYTYDRYYDDIAKWYSQPYPIALRGFREADAKLQNDIRKSNNMQMILAKLLLPATSRVYQASFATQRKIRALTLIEALRIYAAEHEGKLPASLDDITEVPVPLDPMTGQAFDYQLNDGVAVLATKLLPGQDQFDRSSGDFRYEIRIVK